MAAHLPPVPPDQQPRHGTDPAESPARHNATQRHPDPNLAEQGETANVRQNTTNKGLQQDR